MKKVFNWIRKHNEFTFVLLLVVLIWHLAPDLLRTIDPEAGQFSVDVLYIPLIAAVYFFVALLAVWAYIALVWPGGYKMLDELFTGNHYTKWQQLKALLSLFACLVALFAASLLAVTGISSIMAV